MDVSQAEGGTRSGLLWEVERILNELNLDHTLPQILLCENVPELIGKKNIKNFKKWEQKLESLGYTNYVKILNAKDYGVPQNRRRVFVMSILGEYAYDMPIPMKLKYCLEDFEESNVDEKYYLSEKMIEYITADNDRWTGNNDKSIINKSIASTINTGEGSRRCDASNYICEGFPEDFDLKQLVNKGSNKKGEKNKNLIETLKKNKVSDGTFIDAYNKSVRTDGLSGTILAGVDYRNQTFIAVKEKTKKGYSIAEEGDGVYINRPQQKRGVVQKGMIQTLKTDPSDVGVVVKSETICLNSKGGRGGVAGLQPSLQDRIYSDKGVSTALTTCYAPSIASGSDLRIRKLTPKECIRLMGFQDCDYEAMKKVGMSDAMIFHQCGDSIVTTVIIALFSPLFSNPSKHKQIISKYVDDIIDRHIDEID